MRKIIYFILFVLSSTILVWMYSLVLESEQHDNEYAKISFNGKSTTKEYEFDEFNYLYFFNDMDSLTEFTKNTVFVDFVPDLKIINSEEYKVVITANSDVFEKMKVDLSGETSCFGDGKSLIITFIDECYIPVHIDDESYDYDTGLYVSMDKLEVTIFAPIYNLRSEVGFNIDFEAPQCSDMLINIRDAKGTIKNIMANNFELYCSGTSNLELSGEVKENVKLSIRHNTKIDANNLIINKKTFEVSSALLINNLSYIKYKNIYHIQFFSIYNIIKLILYVSPLFWVGLFIISCCIRKTIKLNNM